MSTALIGHTGFVGSTLANAATFDACYNSSNIETIAGREFDLLICAGARAEKWIANRDPVADRAGIDRLVGALATVKARRAVLISTIDVFRSAVEVDEATPVVTDGLHAYGTHRYYLEAAFAEQFDAVILRLPGLYGHGLKKNAIYDFLHDHQTDKIDSRGVFQFYGVDRLLSDIGIALAQRLALVHLPTEPVSVADVVREAFGRTFVNHVVDAPARYDLRTRYASLFGGMGAYLESRAQVLERIRGFVAAERAEA